MRSQFFSTFLQNLALAPFDKFPFRILAFSGPSGYKRAPSLLVKDHTLIGDRAKKTFFGNFPKSPDPLLGIATIFRRFFFGPVGIFWVF